jgi:uncharacterized membrane protein YebE (DUF533 family)
MSQRKLPEGSSSSIALEPEVAIALIGLYSAAADGEGISAPEEDTLSEMLEGIGVFDEYSEADFEELTKKATTLIEEEEPEELISQAIASLPNQEYRETAYITAILVVGADEEMGESEEDYLYELQGALNISDDRAEEIIDAIFGDYEDDEYEEEEE